MFKKILTVVGVIVLGLAITAVITIISVSSNIVSHADPKAIFLKNVRENVASSHWSDSQLIDLATASCAALKEGHSIREITYVIATNDAVDSTEIEPISSVVGYGISAYCPEIGDNKLKEYSGTKH